MSNVCDKLKDFFTFKGVNLSNVEVECGFSKNSLRKSFDRGSAIGSDKLMVILATYPEISAEWLMRGKGEMLLGATVPQPQNKFPRIMQLLEDTLAENAMLKARLAKKGKMAVGL